MFVSKKLQNNNLTLKEHLPGNHMSGAEEAGMILRVVAGWYIATIALRLTLTILLAFALFIPIDNIIPVMSMLSRVNYFFTNPSGFPYYQISV